MKNLLKKSNSISDNATISGYGPAVCEAIQFIEELLQQGLTLRIRVTGQSMRPYIDSNDTVTMTKVEPRQLKKGDLVLFKTPSNRLILHRLIRISLSMHRGYLFFTKGDALSVPDPSFGNSALLGRVIKIQKTIPLIGFINIDLTTPYGKIFNYIIFLSSIPKGKAFARIKSGVKRISECLTA